MDGVNIYGLRFIRFSTHLVEDTGKMGTAKDVFILAISNRKTMVAGDCGFSFNGRALTSREIGLGMPELLEPIRRAVRSEGRVIE